MQAVAINQFGGIDTLSLQNLPVPEIQPDQVLIRVESAGVGRWDAVEREGEFVKMGMRETPKFPFILGSEGAGEVVAVGDKVSNFKKGDRVYGLSENGGFYAEYAAIKAEKTWAIPDEIPTEQAGALAIDAGTGLRGLTSVLDLQEGETLMLFGASGGMGHLVVQLAKRMGARVFAIASGDDGVALAQRLGADLAVDGHKENVAAAARKFAPDGLDAALVTSGGKAVDEALQAIRDGGRVAYPNGVQPEPKAPKGVRVQSFDGEPDRELMKKLHKLIAEGPFEVHLGKTFPFAQAADAQRMLKEHYLGRIILRPS